MRRRVSFNGKFLSAHPSGVHRVARELILGCDNILSEKPEYLVGRDWRIVKPRDAKASIPVQNIDISVLRPLTWQFWEQITLPMLTSGDLIVNLCNLAPIYRDGITMIHDAQVFISPKSYSTLFRNWYQFALPVIGRNAARIITVSAYSKDMLVKYGVASSDKIDVIYNGVDHILREKADSGILRQLKLTGSPFVCALANTQHHKNIGLLLQAFARSSLSRVKLVLVGAASASDFEQKGLSLSENVVFAGAVTDGQLRALYEAAACFAFPSLTEGFGLPALEAMRVGCLAVVAPRGALPEVCGDAALYVDPNDPDAWTRAIELLVEPSDELSDRRRKSITHAEAFTWRRSAEKLMPLIATESGARRRR
jgi:glycosyltransferase involved in cell wall biosynthesis